MRTAMLEILCCPDCKGNLILSSAEKGQSVEMGALSCVQCKKTFPVVGGIPRFVQTDDYLRNFGMEWTIHSRTAFDSQLGKPVSEYMFQTRIGFQPAEVRNKIVLDAGCGSGRLLDIVRKYDGIAVGLDYTVAIDTAAKNLWPDEKVMLVQGDILHPPFKPEAFDLVFSNGVIHHTPNPPKAFSCLASLVKHDGSIAVWVYPDEGILGRIPNRTAFFYRIVTTRIPLNVLYRVCKSLQQNVVLPQVLYEDFFDTSKALRHGHHNPRQALYVLLPFWSFAPFKDWRVMDTFDFLSPRYKFAYSYDQVAEWFRMSGMRNVVRLPFPVAVKGTKA